jgi:hypothetical protein
MPKRTGSYFGASTIIRCTPNPTKEETDERETRAKLKREKRINVIERARRSVRRPYKK